MNAMRYRPIAVSPLIPEPYRTRLVQASAMHFPDNGTARRARVIDDIRREAAVEHPELFVSAEEELRAQADLYA